MRNPFQILNLKALPVVVLAVLAFAMAGASAQSDKPLTIDIKPQQAGSALVTLAKSSGIQILFAKGAGTQVEVEGLKGEYRFEEALAALLTHTNLEYKFASEELVLVQPAEQSANPEADEEASAEEGVEEPDDPLELGTQNVTGSRLVRLAWQNPGQTIVIDREDLENTGAPTLEQALRQLPQNINGTTEFAGARLYDIPDNSGSLLGTSNINGSSTINLRGLGESATLILIDGKRIGDSGMLGGFTDISEIPMSIVDRVEIQLDGSSSIYGSDAIGGVVNVILRDDYDLLKVSMRRTSRTRGGHAEHNASLAAGTTWDTGSVSLNVDGYKSSSQGVDQTNFNLLGTERYGYPGNVRGRRGSLSSPREISGDLSQAARDAGLISEDEDALRALIPEGQDGTALTLADFVNSVGSFRTNAGAEREISMTPASDRFTFRLTAKQELADWLDVSGGITYSTRRTSSDSGDAVGEMTFDVAEENPYNPFGRDVEVDIVVPGFGTRIVRGERDSLTLDLDFDGLIGNRWRWQWRSRVADRESLAETENFVSHDRLNDLVDDERTDRAAALNIFGNSFHADGNNAEVLAGGEFLTPLQTSTTTNRLASSELMVEGLLFGLPGGDARGVLGAEWRRASVDVEYGTTFMRVITAGAPTGSSAILDGFALKGTRTVKAGFTELFFPILSNRNGLPLAHDLNVVLSGRHESADGSSSAGVETESHYQSNIWSAGLVYRPIQSVALRVNKSTSYRAPDVAYALFPPLVAPRRILDFRTGGFRRTTIENISGGNPQLKPEESTSLTWGVQVMPAAVPGLHARVDWHDTLFRNRIARLNPFGSLFVFDTTFNRFRFQYTLDEEGRITSFDARSTNIAWVDTRGVDLQLAYEFAAGANSFAISANVAVTNHHKEDINTFDEEEALQHVELYIPERIYRVNLTWRRSGLLVALNARTKSSLHYEKRQPLSLEAGASIFEVIQVETDPATVVDFRGTLDVKEFWQSAPGFLENVVVAVGLNNIFKSFDKVIMTPEPFENLTGRPRGVNDARGQMFYLELSKEF